MLDRVQACLPSLAPAEQRVAKLCLADPRAFTMLPVALYGLGLREALFNVLLGTFYGTPSATATLISLGGFGAQAVVALLGVFFLPFIKFLGIDEVVKK